MNLETKDLNGTGEQLRSLIDFAKSVDLEEVVWEKGAQRIAFKRKMGPAPQESAATPSPTESETAAEAASKTHVVTSPMVGRFQRSQGKDRPVFVLEGDTVTVGQRLAMVEAMQIPKDVISTVSGKIVKIFVENGKPVEYGQKLFEVEIA